jgi:acetylornithine deacetylase/succinyl-diaminopimelate desuccinylase-like protein
MRLTPAVALLVASTSLMAAPSADVLRVREWRTKNERQILAELMQLVALPNLASNREDIARNAQLLTSMFEKRGFTVSRWDTKGSPVVFARRDAASPRGTVLFYMHYDGQPANAKEWTLGAPFSPAAFNGTTPVDLQAGTGPVDPNVRIYARSASDDKGPIVALLAAVAAGSWGGQRPSLADYVTVIEARDRATAANVDYPPGHRG